jgi:hypothetical protein
MLVGQQHVYASIILGPYAAGLVILKKSKMLHLQSQKNWDWR